MRSIKKISVLLVVCMVLLITQSAFAIDVTVLEGATEVHVPLNVITTFPDFAGAQFNVSYSSGLEAFTNDEVNNYHFFSRPGFFTPMILDRRNADGSIYAGMITSGNFYETDSEGNAYIGDLKFNYISDDPETITIYDINIARLLDSDHVESTTFNSITFDVSRIPNTAAKVSLKGPASVVSSPGATMAYTFSVEGMPTVAGIELEFEMSADFLSYLNNSGFNSPSGFGIIGAGTQGTLINWTSAPGVPGYVAGAPWIGKLTILNPNVAGTSGDMDLCNLTFGVIPDTAGDITFKLTNVILSYAGGTITSQIDRANNTVNTKIIDPASAPTPAPTPTPPQPTPTRDSSGLPGGPGAPSNGNTPLITGAPPDEEDEITTEIEDEEDEGLPGGPADVDKLIYIPFINGYPDGTVQPDGMLTRAELAQILYNLHSGGGSYTADYTDVTSDHWANNAIGFCQENGYMIGYPEGDFQPESTVTRAEICTTLVRLIGLELAPDHPFPDVGDHWSNDYVGAAYAGGLVEGYPDGTFHPDDAVTRAEAVTMICRAEARDESLFDLYKVFPDLISSYWGYEYVMNAANGYNYYDMG